MEILAAEATNLFIGSEARHVRSSGSSGAARRWTVAGPLKSGSRASAARPRNPSWSDGSGRARKCDSRSASVSTPRPG